MKQQDINTLLKHLKKRVAYYIGLNFIKPFPNNNIYINDILYKQNEKQVYFNDIPDNKLIISFFLFLYSEKTMATRFQFTINKSHQIEYICSKNKSIAYDIPMSTDYRGRS